MPSRSGALAQLACPLSGGQTISQMAILGARSLSLDRPAIPAGLVLLIVGLSRVRSHRPRLVASWPVWVALPIQTAATVS
jgi:hypothetical protein